MTIFRNILIYRSSNRESSTRISTSTSLSRAIALLALGTLSTQFGVVPHAWVVFSSPFCTTTTVVVQSGKNLTRASDELNELLTAARCVRVTDPTKLITLLKRFDLVLYQPLRGRLDELVLVKPNPGGRHHAGLMVHLSNFYPENELGDFYPDAGYMYSLAHWQVFFFS